MSGYKLYYFTGRVGGEIVRLSFAAANIEYMKIFVWTVMLGPKKKHVSRQVWLFCGVEKFGVTYNPQN